MELRECREKSASKNAELQEAQLKLQQLQGADRVGDDVKLLEGIIKDNDIEKAKLQGSLTTTNHTLEKVGWDGVG